MVEISSMSKKENSSLKENLPWRDIQGLGCTLEESSFELNDKFCIYACV